MRARVLVVAACVCAAAATTSTAAPAPASGGVAGRDVRTLAGPVPEWYTPALHARVVAAGERGESVPLPPGAEVPASALAFTGIRPGSWMVFPAWCTMNFVFGSPSDYFIGTAGHCAQTGETVTVVAAPGVLMSVGSTVKSVDQGVGNDFALVDVRPAMERHVSPSIAVVGGPTGSRAPALRDVVVHVGHGVGVGAGGTARAGVVTWVDAPAYGWDGAAAPGDSGSPVRLATGPAVGNLTHLVVGTRYLPAVIAGTGINRILTIAGKPLALAGLIPEPLP